MFTVIPRSLLARSPGGARATAGAWGKQQGGGSPVLSAPTNSASAPAPPPLSLRSYHEVTGDIICPSMVMGIDHLRDPRLNKGLAFTLEERQALGIHGLQPARFKSQEEQLEICRISLERYQDDLNKYLYLVELQDRNERLFFRLLSENIEKMLPIVYTPTVGLACQKFGLIYRRPRGLFITINDKGHVYNVLKNWPEPDVRAIVVTDGERILGLGDLGACGMGIPVGKLSLYTALASIKPHQCLPVTLDVGTNNENLLGDPLYIGLRQKRTTGEEYDEFVDEFMRSVVKRYGQNTLIQFEDFAQHNAFRLLEKFRYKYCTFNDDIQGTAAVVCAGLLASVRITKRKISENIYLFLGAGGAATGIANLTCAAMQHEGLTEEQARDRIYMADVNGLLCPSRPGGLTGGPADVFCKDQAPEKDLNALVSRIKPSCLIGASAAGGAFTTEVLQNMAAINQRPIIFALSNPTDKAECTAEAAYTHTEGRCVFSSGSPFPEVNVHGKTFHPGQGNNAYIFPGIALGVITTATHHIPEAMFLRAAQTLANFVAEDDLAHGSIYPPLKSIRDISLAIAIEVAKMAYEEGLASVYPDPKDYERFIKTQLYNSSYGRSLPITYTWPEDNPDHYMVRPLPKSLRDEGQQQRAPIAFNKH